MSSQDPPDHEKSDHAEPARAQTHDVARFASLSIPAFRLLWWSTTFSFMGVQMQFLLRALLAWDLSEREGALGVVFLAFGLALLISTPLGGVAADRLRKQRLMLWGQAILTVSATCMGLAVIFNVASFWMLLIAAVIQGSMFGLIGPARISYTTLIVGPALVGNAVTLQTLSMSITRVFAPSLAGILAGVAAFGIGGGYLIAAGFNIISFVLLLWLEDVAPKPNTQHSSPLREILDGVKFVNSRPDLRRLVVCSLIVVMFGFNYIAFMPALIEGTFGLNESYVGLIGTASSFGAIAVAIPLASKADSPMVGRLTLLMGTAFGIGVLLLAGTPNFLLAFFVVILVGGAATGFLALSQSRALQLSDEEHQGRVQSLVQLSFAGFGIAAAPLGWLAEVVGLRAAIVLMGVVVLAATAAYTTVGIRLAPGRPTPATEVPKPPTVAD